MVKRGTRRRKGGKARSKANGDTTVLDLPDDLLDQVLHHLDSPISLVRAAAACRRWRRAVADEGFLARHGALHGASRVAGHYYVTDAPAPAPAPPNAAGRERRGRVVVYKTATFVPSSSPAVADHSALFSLGFLSSPPVKGVRVRLPRNSNVVDSCGSLLLLTAAAGDARRWSPDFVVCEPATRRLQRIPLPAGLSRYLFLGAFLLDGGGGGGDAMSGFRVLCVLGAWGNGNRGTPRACVFAPGARGGWRLGWHTMDDDIQVMFGGGAHLAGRAAGRIYWGVEASRTVLVLDEGTLRFSLVQFPEHMRWAYRRTSFRVIGGGGGADTARVVRMDAQELVIYGQLPGSAGQWVVEKSVRVQDVAAGLPGWGDGLLAQPARIVAVGETFVLLTASEKTWLFSVDLETMELEREHERSRHPGPAFPCTVPWRPVLQACLDHGEIAVSGSRRQRRN